MHFCYSFFFSLWMLHRFLDHFLWAHLLPSRGRYQAWTPRWGPTQPVRLLLRGLFFFFFGFLARSCCWHFCFVVLIRSEIPSPWRRIFWLRWVFGGFFNCARFWGQKSWERGDPRTPPEGLLGSRKWDRGVQRLDWLSELLNFLQYNLFVLVMNLILKNLHFYIKKT